MSHTLHHSLRPTGVVEYPVDDDPTRLVQYSDGEGGTCYRAECEYCRYKGAICDLPGAARAACKSHASTQTHNHAYVYAKRTRAAR